MTNETSPPKRTSADTRFKPGISGNRNGRPKGARNKSTIVDEELNSLIAVTENGKKKKISKWRAALKQQVNKAVQGDLRAFRAIEEIRERHPSIENTPNPPELHSDSPSQAEPVTEEEAARIHAEALKKAQSNE